MLQTLAQLRSGQLVGAARLDLQAQLTEFPREIFDLADSLEILNLSGNRLSSLPGDLPRLSRLRILFCSENEFTALPEVIGACPSLSMVGFKSNQLTHIPGTALPPRLRWLILTDNRISELPPELGRCTALQKLMLSGNRLRHLPEEMAACRNLELLRLAANELAVLPPWLLRLPHLTWLAFSGNPCAAASDPTAPPLAEIPWDELEMEHKLGEGASGEIHRAAWRANLRAPNSVAVKMFKGAVTSDGLPSCEMKACLAAGSHAHLIPLQGRITAHPEGRQGLVMPLIDPAYRTLAGPPSLETCTRDVYPEGQRFSANQVLALAAAVASAAKHLHAQGILHGDLYAHNVLWNPAGHAYVGDFGAATFYHSEDATTAPLLERLEVRAWGCLLEELLERGVWTPEDAPLKNTLQTLQERCVAADVAARPSFAEVLQELVLK